jgi:hypothetical protein
MNIYSYSQLSQYLASPKKYRYRYIDGWQERDTRAATIFGRVFEHALGALFRREDPAAAFQALFEPLLYSSGSNSIQSSERHVEELYCLEMICADFLTGAHLHR